MSCGCSGNWVIVYSTSNVSGSQSLSVSGFKNDAPYFPPSVKYASCPYGRDLVSSCDGRVMYSGWTCYSPGLQLISATFQPGPNCSSSYDCINGYCVQSTQYNTPGIYESLADCQAVCANGGACGSSKQCVDPTTFCPPGQICIEQGEWNSIQGLIAKISSEVC